MRRLLSVAAFMVLAALASASAQRGHARSGWRLQRLRWTRLGRQFDSLASADGSFRRNPQRSEHELGSFLGGSSTAIGLEDRVFRRGASGIVLVVGEPTAIRGMRAMEAITIRIGGRICLLTTMKTRARVSACDEMNAASLEEQRLREREDRDQDMYARRAQPREERTAQVLPTALVFRDQHVEEVRNYAIAGGTLWVLNEQAAKKIPLAQLDLAATVKMNDERGLDFQVPR